MHYLPTKATIALGGDVYEKEDYQLCCGGGYDYYYIINSSGSHARDSKEIG
ncbi:hypothetical protein D3C73_1634930 [compost metagenome]